MLGSVVAETGNTLGEEGGEAWGRHGFVFQENFSFLFLLTLTATATAEGPCISDLGSGAHDLCRCHTFVTWMNAGKASLPLGTCEGAGTEAAPWGAHVTTTGAGGGSKCSVVLRGV